MRPPPVRRWKCPHCSTEGWSKDGSLPVDHDRPDGRVCRKSVIAHTTAPEWHRCVETMMTMASLPLGLGPLEAVIEFQKWLNDRMVCAAPNVEQIAGIVSDYYDEDASGRWRKCAEHIASTLSSQQGKST